MGHQILARFVLLEMWSIFDRDRFGPVLSFAERFRAQFGRNPFVPGLVWSQSGPVLIQSGLDLGMFRSGFPRDSAHGRVLRISNVGNRSLGSYLNV